MKAFLLVAIVVALLLFLILDLGERAVEPSPVTVKTVQQWGRVAPPYVIEAPTTTTVPARARTAPKVRAASAGVPVLAGDWSCGGDLPPCWVMDRENPNRDLTVYNGGSHHEPGYTGGNPEGDSTASGKWQFLRSTWKGFGGFVNAADAPASVQDAKARELWDHGRGCSAWSACV